MDITPIDYVQKTLFKYGIYFNKEQLEYKDDTIIFTSSKLKYSYGDHYCAFAYKNNINKRFSIAKGSNLTIKKFFGQEYENCKRSV